MKNDVNFRIMNNNDEYIYIKDVLWFLFIVTIMMSFTLGKFEINRKLPDSHELQDIDNIFQKANSTHRTADCKKLLQSVHANFWSHI